MLKWSSKRFANCYCYERHGRVWVSLFGQRYRRSLKLLWTPENKELALKRLDFIAEQYSQADYERPEDITLEDLLEQFRDFKYGTIDRVYKLRFEHIFDRYLTETDILLRQTDYIESMITRNVKLAIEQHGNSYNGVKKQLEYLAQLFNYAIKRGKTNVNPARLINDNIKPQDIDRDVLPIEVYEKALRLLRKTFPPTAYLIELLYLTGMRINEAVTIEKKDIDFVNDILTIRGKGGKNRTFPLSGRFKELKQLLLEIHEENYHPTKLFYWVQTETPRKQFRHALIELGVHKDGMSFHSIRKLFINRLIDDNYPIRSAADLVGHTVRIMEKHYLKRQSAKKQAEIAEKHQ